MIKAEKYDVCQYILPVRMICLFITFLFLVFGVYAQCCNAVQFGGATASLAGFLLIVISYFHSRFTSIRGLQYEANPLNSHEVVYSEGFLRNMMDLKKNCLPPIRNNFADFTLTRRP